MIRNIIFDVGKVLVSYEPEEYMKRLGFSEEKRKRINEAMFENPLWDESDQGLRTTEELLKAFIANAPDLADEIRMVYQAVGDTIELLPYALEWIQDLKAKGYKIYILSNYSENTFNQTQEKLKFLPVVDGAVFSYEIKLLKPDAAIYDYLCEKYQLIPEESVFLDDRPVNIEGARKKRIHGIVFCDYEQGKRELEKLLEKN